MTNKDERTALVKILADLIEQQKILQSKTLEKTIHHLKLWVNRLYRDATKRVVADCPPSVYIVSTETEPVIESLQTG